MTATTVDAASGVTGLGTILGIWAHPDDEAYLSAGLMASARDRGSRVVCVTATRGERGTPDPQNWPPDRLAAVRTTELAECLRLLGVTEHRWLDYPDGGCAEVSATEAVGRLCDVLSEVRPDTVVTFGPDGITGHADHRAVGAWATAAFDRAAQAGARLLYAAVPETETDLRTRVLDELQVYEPGYPIKTPDRLLAVDLLLDAATAERKVKALAAQATQTEQVIGLLGLETYTAWVARESFVDRVHSPRGGS